MEHNGFYYFPKVTLGNMRTWTAEEQMGRRQEASQGEYDQYADDIGSFLGQQSGPVGQHAGAAGLTAAIAGFGGAWTAGNTWSGAKGSGKDNATPAILDKLDVGPIAEKVTGLDKSLKIADALKKRAAANPLVNCDAIAAVEGMIELTEKAEMMKAELSFQAKFGKTTAGGEELTNSKVKEVVAAAGELLARLLSKMKVVKALL